MNDPRDPHPGSRFVPFESSNSDSVKDFADSKAPIELQQARALWSARRINESLRMYDRAAGLYPDHVAANLEAAQAFANRLEIAKAEALLGRLRQGNKLNSDGQNLLVASRCYRSLGRFDEAIQCLGKALSQSSDDYQAHLELGQIFDRLNQVELGLEHIAACLKNCPRNPEGLLCLGQLLRRNRQVNQAETILVELASDCQTPSSIRIGAFYQLGYLLDELGQYDQAFQYVLKAKEIQQTEAAELVETARQEISKLAELWKFARSDLQRWQYAMDSLPRERLAFLLGVPRSGTTLLERVLQSHPSISSTDEELFLSQVIFPELLNNRDQRKLQIADLDQWSTGRMKIDRERYFRYVSSVLRQDSHQRLHIDKNPSLIRLLPAILRLFPEAKILFALRDPRDLVVSCFMRQFPMNAVSVEYLTLESTANSVVRDLELWRKFRTQLPNNWLEVHYEEVVSDLASTSRKTLDFLGLPWDASVLAFHQLTTPVNSPTYEAVAKPIYQQAKGRWANYEKSLSPVLHRLDAVRNGNWNRDL